MIESDIKTIKKHHTTTNKSLKKIADWQKHHEIEDNIHFKEINDAIKNLPTEQAITEAVAKSVQVTVNGKIDKIALHLGEQDKNLEEFRKQLKPLDGTRRYIIMSGKVLAYILSLAIGFAAVVELVKAIISK